MLWGFNGGESDLRCLYEYIHVDTLHQSDLGVFKTIGDVLCKDDNTHNWILQEMDHHLLYIRRTSCHPSFQIPGMERGGRFPCLIQNRIK